MVALMTDTFGLKSSKLAQLDSTKFDEEPFCAREEPNTGVHTLRTFAADSSCDCFATNR